ncbi:hypothetical protein AB205_0062050, partial [Aquarana catesbeiana]
QEEYLQEDSEDDYISTLETTLAALQNKVKEMESQLKQLQKTQVATGGQHPLQ